MTLGSIDEVSETLGRLDEKLSSLNKTMCKIESHLKDLNGTVAAHQAKIPLCEKKFDELNKTIGSVKWDYKFWGAITGLVIVISALIKITGY